jgi:hypothetical protein
LQIANCRLQNEKCRMVQGLYTNFRKEREHFKNSCEVLVLNIES